MRKIRKTAELLGLTALFAFCLQDFARADVAAGPMFAVIIGVPLAIIAAAVIIITIIVKAVRKKRPPRDGSRK